MDRMFSGPKKPYSAVTVQIEQLTSESYDENDVAGIVDLVEVIRIQDTGPTEAARALRKKLKYGNLHRQLRALTIIDGLIENAGVRFQRTFADEPLLERLRLMPRDEMVDPDVRTKCNQLYRKWAVMYKDTRGLESIASLHRQLPKTRKPQPAQSKVVRETEREAAIESSSPPKSPVHSPSASRSTPASRPVTLGHTSSSSFFSRGKDKDKNKNKKQAAFNLEKEKGKLMETIAASSVSSTNLINAIKLINREDQRVSENPECRNRFDQCKQLRRQILRYIQFVESEQYIGSLLSANDELVKALMAYEVMDKSIEDDSDSDVEYLNYKAARRLSGARDTEDAMAQLSIDSAVASPPKPPRPTQLPPAAVPIPAAGKQRYESSDEEDEVVDEDPDDPFGDSHALKTPGVEKGGMTWRDV